MDRQSRKNLYILLVDAAAYAMFGALWDVNTVIPVFLDRIDSPSWLIGATVALKQLGYLIPQPVLLTQFHRVNSLTGFMRLIMLVDRPQLLVFLLCLLLMAHSPALLIAFFISFAILCFGEGTILLPWVDLMGWSLKPEGRGRFWGTVQAVGGLASLGAGFTISGILDNPKFPYPYNFLLIFGVGALILLPSIILFQKAEDPVLPVIKSPPKWEATVRKCLGNKQFLFLVVVQSLAGCDALAIPYYIVMVRHKFPALAPCTGTYILLSIIGGVSGGILWGILSDKRGSYRTITAITFFKTLTAGIFLTTQFNHSPATPAVLLGAGFILLGAVTAGWVGFINYLLNIAAHEERSSYLALNNTVLFPAAFLPILGGLLREYRGDMPLYLITTAATATAFLLSFRLKNLR